MKKVFFPFIVFFITIISFLPQKANASWAGAGEMYYTWLSDSTYRVYIRYYRTCTGIPSNSNITCCLSSSCATTTYTFSLYPVTSSSVVVPASCPSYPTRCIVPTSTLPGYQATLFYSDVTLPYRCSSWKFSTSPDAAEASQNAVGGMMYLEAMINNTGTYQGNTSPYVPPNGIYYVCNSYAASYNSNATDANNDSLDTEVMAPMDGNVCGPPSPTAFKSATPTLRLPDNPFQTNNTFVCDRPSGVMSFTPGGTGNQFVSVKIKEYRGGVLIGYITRSVRFYIFDCSAKPPAVGTTVSYTGTYSTVGGLSGCPGAPIGVSVDLKSTTGSVLVASDNKSLLPGTPSITYSNQNTDSIRAVFSWTPPASLASKTKTYYLSFNVKDSSCNSSMPAIVNSAIVIPITIWGKPVAYNDTTICKGKSATLVGQGGGNYTWSLISGSPGSLSCTSCTTTIATPNVLSVYQLTSGVSAFCGNNLDTVTVTLTNPLTPSVTVTANPGTTVTTGTSVTFTAYPGNCSTPLYTWKKNGIVIGTGSATYTTNTLVTGDVISCQIVCSDECITSPNAGGSVTMTVNPVSINNVETNNTIAIVPNPNNGKFTIVMNDKTISGKVEITNILGQVIYTGNASQPEIDLHTAPQGIYMLRVHQGDKTYSLRFAVDK